MVVAYHIANEIAVYLGDGHGAFLNETMYSTGFRSNPYMVAVDDFNNDSRLDVAVADFGTNSIGIFHGSGNGSFEDQKKLSTGLSRPIFILIVDLNNDILADIVTANYGTDSISIFYGGGKADFSDPVTYATGYDSLPLSLAAGDFNNDHYVDIAVANYGTGTLGILFGIRNDTFANQIIVATNASSHPSSIAVGHINDDVFLDIVVANYGTRDIRVLLGNANGNFANQMTYAIESASPYFIGIGDLNQDDKMDLIVTSYGRNNIAVLLGSSSGTFTSRTKYYSTGSASSNMVAMGDLNKDHRLDILVVNNNTGVIDVLLGSFEGFAEQKSYPAGVSPQSAAAGDFNNDSRLDIVVTNWRDSNVSVLLGNGDGSFADQTTYPTALSPQSLVVGYFNGDSRLGTFVATSGDGAPCVLLQHNRGALTKYKSYASGGGSSLRYVAVLDLNNDSRLDIIVANYGTGSVGALLGLGDGTFQSQTMLLSRPNSNPSAIAIGDYDGDLRKDMAVMNYGTRNVDMLLGNGEGSFTPQTDVGFRFATAPFLASSGDFNNDGRSEILVAYDGNDNVDILRAYDTGSFKHPMPYPTRTGPQSVVVGDFNNDSHLDIVVANAQDISVSVLLGTTQGSVANQIHYSTGSSPQSVAVGDLNNDYRLDIVVTNGGDGNVSVLLGNGDGSFANQTTYLTGSRSQSVAVGDFNNDHRLDIVVANYDDNNVCVLLGNGNGTFAAQKPYPTGIYPQAVAVGDFNNDNRLDLVVANSADKSVSVLLGNGNGSFADQRLFNWSALVTMLCGRRWSQQGRSTGYSRC